MLTGFVIFCTNVKDHKSHQEVGFLIWIGLFCINLMNVKNVVQIFLNVFIFCLDILVFYCMWWINLDRNCSVLKITMDLLLHVLVWKLLLHVLIWDYCMFWFGDYF